MDQHQRLCELIKRFWHKTQCGKYSAQFNKEYIYFFVLSLHTPLFPNLTHRTIYIYTDHSIDVFAAFLNPGNEHLSLRPSLLGCALSTKQRKIRVRHAETFEKSEGRRRQRLVHSLFIFHFIFSGFVASVNKRLDHGRIYLLGSSLFLCSSHSSILLALT